MKKSIIYIFLLFAMFGCRDIKVGYLDCANAGYDPGEIIIKNNLDPNIATDADRINRRVHWVTNPMEGVEGTQPIIYQLERVKDANGKDVTDLFKHTEVRGGGAVDIPYDHKLPIGEYKLTIKIWNEGYDKILEDILSIKVANL